MDLKLAKVLALSGAKAETLGKQLNTPEIQESLYNIRKDNFKLSSAIFLRSNLILSEYKPENLDRFLSMPIPESMWKCIISELGECEKFDKYFIYDELYLINKLSEYIDRHIDEGLRSIGMQLSERRVLSSIFHMSELSDTEYKEIKECVYTIGPYPFCLFFQGFISPVLLQQNKVRKIYRSFFSFTHQLSYNYRTITEGPVCFIDSSNMGIISTIAAIEKVNEGNYTHIYVTNENNSIINFDALGEDNITSLKCGVYDESGETGDVLLAFHIGKEYEINKGHQFIFFTGDSDFSTMIKEFGEKALVVLPENKKKVSIKTLDFYTQNNIEYMSLEEFLGATSKKYLAEKKGKFQELLATLSLL